MRVESGILISCIFHEDDVMRSLFLQPLDEHLHVDIFQIMT